MADEDQNVIRIYRNPDTGVWRASIGPFNDRGFETQGHSGCQALGYLIHQLHKHGYVFDPGWWPTAPDHITYRETPIVAPL